MASVTPIRVAWAALLVLALAGCGKGKSSAISASFAETRARYQVLELASGTMTPVAGVDALLTDVRYRSTHIVFRMVDEQQAPIGAASGTMGSAVDDAQRRVRMPRFYIAAFELTQAQWRALAGSEPWLQLSVPDSPGDVAVGDARPAVGISHELAAAALDDYARRSARRLALPSAEQWEAACRAGGGGVFAWGSALDATTVAAHAQVLETRGGARGALDVGGRAANGYGLHDMHGNVWELTADGGMRGGSWNDPVALARCAGRAAIDDGTEHALVGLRLVYVP